MPHGLGPPGALISHEMDPEEEFERLVEQLSFALLDGLEFARNQFFLPKEELLLLPRLIQWLNVGAEEAVGLGRGVERSVTRRVRQTAPRVGVKVVSCDA